MKPLVLVFVFALNCIASDLQAQTYKTNAEAMAELSHNDGEENLNVRYFYYPNLQAYYDRQTDTYLYTRNGKDWLEGTKLPTGLRGYSIKNGKRVPLKNVEGEEPYLELEKHRKQYPSDYSPKRNQETKSQELTMAY